MKNERKLILALLLLVGCGIAYAAAGDIPMTGRLLIKTSPAQSLTCATSGAVGEACISGDLETNGALDVAGASTLTGAVAAGSTLGVTGLTTTTGGHTTGAVNAITGVDSLTSADCGKLTTVTAGIDTASITLPEASTVIGCTFTIMYIGADAGALLDITPLDSDADGIEGSCTLAASVVTLSGTADADVGFTKASILTGDTMKLTSVGANLWIMHGVTGICANN